MEMNIFMLISMSLFDCSCLLKLRGLKSLLLSNPGN